MTVLGSGSDDGSGDRSRAVVLMTNLVTVLRWWFLVTVQRRWSW